MGRDDATPGLLPNRNYFREGVMTNRNAENASDRDLTPEQRRRAEEEERRYKQERRELEEDRARREELRHEKDYRL